MKLLYKESPRTIVIASDTHSLCFRQVPARGSQASSKSQVAAMELIPNSVILHDESYKPLLNRDVHGCLGFITVDQQVFLAVITGAIVKVASPVNYETVDKIYSVDFISLSKDTWDFATLDSNGMPVPTAARGMMDDYHDDYENSDQAPPYSTEAHPCTELKRLLSGGSFYYSNDFDLTSLLQNRGINQSQLHTKNSHPKVKIDLKHYREEYMWNSFMMDGLFKYRTNLDPNIQKILDDNRFLTTVIRGFAKTTKLNSQGDSITIVSKQSWKRAGTRFNARGIDDDGNVANFVETEFIYNHGTKDSIFSFIQIRGSVPAFWEQDATLINPKVTITRSLEATQLVFNSHFSDICNKYGVCHIVNLLSKTKPPEIAVLSRYRQLYDHSDRQDELSYTEFDFHHEVKQSGGFSGATKILPHLHSSLEQFGWFSYDAEHGEVITRQDGVFRLNCLDCLDRTNLIEQVICQNVLENILKNQSFTHGNSTRDRYEMEDILSRYNALWADNGDALSQIYTGTNALKSSFSRSGKMNLAGALSDVTKSVSRMYQNTFVDNRKQSTMDLLLGYDSKNSIPVRIYDPVSEYVQDKLKAEERTFTSYKDITIFTGTFNMNATLPNPRFDLTSWLFPTENSSIPLPDIYAIGLQELIELNAGSILNADTSRAGKWAQLIDHQLNSQQEQYLLLRTESIASMTVFLFVKKSQVPHVTHVSGSSKKTGLGGITANKGGCAVRFDFGATSFSLITSHLAAGTNAVFERFNDYSSIMSGLTFVRNMNIKDHDHIIWFGDLNYRINLPNDQCRSLVAERQYDTLFENDQLNYEMNSKTGAFKGFQEAPITFSPTYKFDKGTSNYDSSEKQRVPSWTDRIVSTSLNLAPPLSQYNYNSVPELEISDHKPVYATFQSRVKFVDEPRKILLAKQLYNDYKRDHGDVDSSLLEVSSSSSSTKSFGTETLSELNLMDDFDTPPPPRTPMRPSTASSVNSVPPRRVPPPPAARRVGESDLFNQPRASTMPRKLPPRPTDIELTLGSVTDSLPKGGSPAPPPPRKANIPVGFSSTPLIPSRSNSATPLGSPSATPGPMGAAKQEDSVKLTPMVPSKPSSLSGSKVSTPGEKPKSPPGEKPKSPGPVPPPPRAGSTSTTSTNGSNGSNGSTGSRTMSDWKPLVPK